MLTLLRKDIDVARINNQIVLSGANPSYHEDNQILFLEYLDGASYTLKDGSGSAIGGTMTGITNLSQSPLRIDGGKVSIIGTMNIVKGFFVTRMNG